MLLRTIEWCSRLLTASLLVSCTLSADDDDEHPPICRTCVGPAPESAVPAEAGEAEPEDPRPGGFTGAVTGGRGGFGGSGGGFGSPFGTGGRFDTGGGFGTTTGGSSFGSGGEPFGVGGSNFAGVSSAFAGSAAFGGF